MGQECQKCKMRPEAQQNEINKKFEISSDSDSEPEYDEQDEKHPQKPPSMDNKSNSSTFIKEKYISIDSKKDQIESLYNQLKFEDGGIYTGMTINNLANGQGTLEMPNGDIYEGNFINNYLEGDGKCIYQRGPIYTGNFKQGKQNGIGKEIWPDGSIYEGEFKNGKKNGKGNYKWNQQSTYNGEWMDNMINGIGKYEWPDGRSYYGQWNRNQMHGRGIYRWIDGKYYDGEYENDKKSGFGTPFHFYFLSNIFIFFHLYSIISNQFLFTYIFNWPDGKQYQGYWLDGKQHGKGLMINKEGKKKFGEWQNGKLISCTDESNLQLIPDGWFLNSFNK